jgi:hypothetical protein
VHRLSRLQERGRCYAKGLSESADHNQTRISAAALDTAQVSQVDLRLEGQLLLGERPLVAELSHIVCQYRPPVHCGNGADRAYRL